MTLKPMLEGVRILAVEQYGAGPFGTLFLADLGAEVIKIENKADGGDVSRVVGPHFHSGLPETARSVFYQGLNRSKKSITLDLSKPEGQAVFHRLVEHADAVASNLRGDVPAKLGITYRAARRRRTRRSSARISPATAARASVRRGPATTT